MQILGMQRTNFDVLKKESKGYIFKCLRHLNNKISIRSIKLPITNQYFPIHKSIIQELSLKKSDLIELNFDSEANLIGSYTKGTEDLLNVHFEKSSCLHSARAQTDSFLLDIKSQGFSFRNNHLLDRDLNVIDESYNSFKELHVYRNFLEQPKKLEGTIAYLSNATPSNYYHWIGRILPLLRVYKQYNLLSDIDYFYIGNFDLTSWHKDSLTYAGINPKKIIQHACYADRLLVALNNRGKKGNATPMTHRDYKFIRNLFQCDITQTSASKTGKYIYVKRGDNISYRYVLNELKIIQKLQSFGFTIVSMDNKKLIEEIHLFSHAQVIISATGAALTNVLFLNPGATVIELIPYSHVNNCFCALANYSKASYFYVMGEDTKQHNLPAIKRDIQIDTDVLERILLKIFPEK